MKKYIKFTALLTAMVLLSGCAGEAAVTTSQSASVTEEKAVVTSGVTENSSAMTSASETTLTSAKTEEVFSSEPVLSVKPAAAVISEISISKTQEQIGFDVPIDVTALPQYENALEMAEKLSEEERAELSECNYSRMNTMYEFMGKDYADWLCIAEYELRTGGITYPYYSSAYFIKDGKITEQLFGCEERIHPVIRREGSLFMSLWGDGVYEIDVATGKARRLFGPSYMIFEVDSDCVLFNDADYVLKVYNRNSGEIYSTGNHMGVTEGHGYIRQGDKLYYIGYTEEEYTDENGEIRTDKRYTSDFYMEFDLKTGAETVSEITSDEYYGMNNVRKLDTGDYIVYHNYDSQFFTVENKADGLKTDYYINELYGGFASDFRILGTSGEYLYAMVNSKEIMVLDLGTGKAYVTRLDGVTKESIVTLKDSYIQIYDFKNDKVTGVEITISYDE